MSDMVPEVLNAALDSLFTPKEPGELEYQGDDGLLYCRNCHTPVQCRVKLWGRDKIVPCLCRCQQEAMAEKKRQDELVERQRKIRQLKATGIQEKHLLEWNFGVAEDNKDIQMAKRYVEQWKKVKAENLGLLLWGDVGTGKSFVAACIANALLDQGIPVLMTNFSKILNQMGAMYSEERYRYIASFSNYSLLILDDLGIERSTEYALEQVYAVIDERYKSGLPVFIAEMPLSDLHPFEGHPFKVLDDELMEQTVESIKQIGVVSPLIVRPDPEGGFEILSGHRRLHAAQLAGLETVPVIVKEMDDDAAIIFMVDSNLQRENILPSERAFSYKMKLEAMKHQGQRGDLTSDQVGQKSWAVNQLADDANESKTQVQRFIRLTNLIPEILDMVDEKKIAFNPAVELSYLKPSEQKEFLEAMDYAQASPSLSQAQRLKKLSQEGGCTLDAMCEVMNEIKKDELDHVTIKNEVLRKYFPKSYTPKQMQDTIIRLLEKWQRSKQRDMER